MSGVAHISAETAYYLVEQYPIDYVFIDGREGKEQESLGHIEGSSNLPGIFPFPPSLYLCSSIPLSLYPSIPLSLLPSCPLALLPYCPIALLPYCPLPSPLSPLSPLLSPLSSPHPSPQLSHGPKPFSSQKLSSQKNSNSQNQRKPTT